MVSRQVVNILLRNHSTIVDAVVGGKIVAASQILFLAVRLFRILLNTAVVQYMYFTWVGSWGVGRQGVGDL